MGGKRKREKGMEMLRRAPWEEKKVLTEETANSGRMVGLWIMFGFSRRQVAFSLARAASDLILIMS